MDLFDFQKEIPGLKALVSKMSNLTKLTMRDSGDKVDHVCDACGTTESFRGSVEVNGDRMKVNTRSRTQAEMVFQLLESSKSLYGLAIDLQVNLNGPSTDDIPERTRLHGSIINIMRHPSTHTERVRVLEALEGIQWCYICQLSVSLEDVSVGTAVMKALMEGKNKLGRRAELEDFTFYCSTQRRIPAMQVYSALAIICGDTDQGPWLVCENNLL